MSIKRFIAGAVCCECGAMDKIVMYDDDRHQRIRECVKCGFKDVLSNDVGSSTSADTAFIEPLLKKPANNNSKSASNKDIQILNFVDATKVKKPK